MHTLEVLLQIRSTDVSWWESDRRENERQLYKLIGRRILPADLEVEIQSDLTKEGQNRFKTVGGEVSAGRKKKDKVVVGEVNLKKMAKNTAGKKKRGKSTKGGSTSKAKKAKSEQSKSSKQQSTSSTNKDTTDFVDKRPKLLRETGKWVMGKSIQACYVMEDIDSTASCSMAFRPIKKPIEQQNDDPDSKRDETLTSPTKQDADSFTITGRDQKKMIPLATFRSWNKLPKRLNIWVFRFDPDNPTDLSVSDDGGFPRPDLLPLADIFR